ncbi:MAG: DNA polymerase III subunit delta [Flavobacteriales bacterium]|jgi:DNA polymerase-3 subunit delta
MDYQKILRDLQLKQYKPIYYLGGEEAYFIDRITDYMQEHILTDAERAFGQHILYGRDVTMDEVVSIAKSFPMAGERQLVMVKESQDMKEWKPQAEEPEEKQTSPGKKEKKKVDHMASLTAYLNQPTPSTILVFTAKGKKLDKRLKVSKLIESKGVVLQADRLKEHQMPAQIAAMARERGLRLDDASTTLLTEYLGNHLDNVSNALDKLRVVMPEGGTVTTSHIEQYIGISKDYNIWELQKALINKDVLKSNRIIEYFRTNPKENPIQKVLPTLFSFFSRIAIYQSFTDKAAARSALGLYPASEAEFRMAEKAFSKRKLELVISHLRDADRRSKGLDNVLTEDHDLMKELVFKILH